MTDDLTFEELPPGRYNGTVEKIRYSFKVATHITYKLGTPNGEVRHNDDGAATGDTKLRGKRQRKAQPKRQPFERGEVRRREERRQQRIEREVLRVRLLKGIAGDAAPRLMVA
jgi:hypothetical protein